MSELMLQNAMRLHQGGRLSDAARVYKDVLRTNPRNFQALYLLGFVHFQTEEYEDAQRLMGEALKINPASPDGYYNRGCALQKLKRDQEALACFDQALKLKPDYPEALFNRGTALLKVNRCADALVTFDRVLVRTPRDAEAWHNRGDALGALGRTGEAIGSYDKALSLTPDSAPSLTKRGHALMALKHYEDAARDFARVLKLDPKAEHARGNLLYCNLHCCDWRNVSEHTQIIEAELQAGTPAITPLAFLTYSDSPADQRRCAELWANDQSPASATPLWRGERFTHEKIRLAYLSRDFRPHAVALLIAGVIEQHDRQRFEIIGISWGADDDSPVRQRLKQAFDRFIDIEGKTDHEAAELLRGLDIDIAIDLMGFTGGARTGILAERPAPVQVNYLGMACTTGTDFFDYIIADPITIPEKHFEHFSERVVHLPECFQPNDSKRRVSDTRPTRAQERLPEDGFVFCSFNNSCKIMPEIFDVWMRLLTQVEGSVLWLPEYNPAETHHLRREAEARGVPGDRIIFAQLVPTPEEYLARMALADLFLDTSPYNAHTTASDALWMGVPLVTFLGTSYAARVAASLLHAMGVPELVTSSVAEYEALALRLARDKPALQKLRERIQRDRSTSALFDTTRYTRHLESAYAQMAQRARRGESPAHFAVPPLP